MANLEAADLVSGFGKVATDIATGKDPLATLKEGLGKGIVTLGVDALRKDASAGGNSQYAVAQANNPMALVGEAHKYAIQTISDSVKNMADWNIKPNTDLSTQQRSTVMKANFDIYQARDTFMKVMRSLPSDAISSDKYSKAVEAFDKAARDKIGDFRNVRVTIGEDFHNTTFENLLELRETGSYGAPKK